MVADYLSSDPSFWGDMKFSDVFEWFDEKDVHHCRHVDDYIHVMRNDSTWGGALEIQSICNMFNIGIRVHTGGRIPIEFVPAAAIKPLSPIEYILDITWNGCHFQAISEIAQQKKATGQSKS
jgi:hypothetical protein